MLWIGITNDLRLAWRVMLRLLSRLVTWLIARLCRLDVWLTYWLVK